MYAKIFVGIYVVLALYIYWQLNYWFRSASRAYADGFVLRTLYTLIYFALASLPLVGTFLPDEYYRWMAKAAGNYCYGFLAAGGALLLVLHILRAIILTAKGRHGKDRKKVGKGAAIWVLILIFLFTFGLNGYGFYKAQDVNVTTKNITVNKSAGALDSLKVVLIADLHLDTNSFLRQTDRMVDLINLQNPDIVLFAGDMFTSSYDDVRRPEAYIERLSRIRATIGKYAVYGNHDVDEPLFCGFDFKENGKDEKAPRDKRMTRFIEKAGFKILDDEYLTLASGSVTIAGRKDGLKLGDGSEKRLSAGELLGEVNKDRPILVLEHEPMEYTELAAAGADVVLSGHTHAGQIYPGEKVAKEMFENTYGVSQLHGIMTVVTSGVGYYGPPLRLGSSSEIMVINLEFAPAEQAPAETAPADAAAEQGAAEETPAA